MCTITIYTKLEEGMEAPAVRFCMGYSSLLGTNHTQSLFYSLTLRRNNISEYIIKLTTIFRSPEPDCCS